MWIYIYQQNLLLSFTKTDKFTLAIVNYSLQSLNIVLQMKTTVNESLTIVYNS
jgi:hypothetical protein